MGGKLGYCHKSMLRDHKNDDQAPGHAVLKLEDENQMFLYGSFVGIFATMPEVRVQFAWVSESTQTPFWDV